MIDLPHRKKATFNKIEWLLRGSVKDCSLNFNHKLKKKSSHRINKGPRSISYHKRKWGYHVSLEPRVIGSCFSLVCRFLYVTIPNAKYLLQNHRKMRRPDKLLQKINPNNTGRNHARACYYGLVRSQTFAWLLMSHVINQPLQIPLIKGLESVLKCGKIWEKFKCIPIAFGRVLNLSRCTQPSTHYRHCSGTCWK